MLTAEDVRRYHDNYESGRVARLIANPPRWTAVEVELLRSVWGTGYAHEIAALFPMRTVRAIQAKAGRLGLPFWPMFYERLDIDQMIDQARAEALAAA